MKVQIYKVRGPVIQAVTGHVFRTVVLARVDGYCVTYQAHSGWLCALCPPTDPAAYCEHVRAVADLVHPDALSSTETEPGTETPHQFRRRSRRPHPDSRGLGQSPQPLAPPECRTQPISLPVIPNLTPKDLNLDATLRDLGRLPTSPEGR